MKFNPACERLFKYRTDTPALTIPARSIGTSGSLDGFCPARKLVVPHESFDHRLELGRPAMWGFFERILDSSMFSPHGICLLWEPELIWLHVTSDAVIATAYFSIPVALSIFVSKRRDVDFGWIFWAFAIFIMACGFTHVLSIVTLWVPAYSIEAIVKVMTAVASIVTAVMLWPARWASFGCNLASISPAVPCHRRRSFARPK
jgi:hypothetical protein